MGSRRTIFAAGLAITLAGAAALDARGGSDPSDPKERGIEADSLPWKELAAENAAVLAAAPAALLYVLPSCGHCDPVAVAFAREARRIGLRSLIVAGSSHEEARAYGVRFALPAIATDSSRDFARAAGIRLVPSLVTFPGGSIRVEPVPGAHAVRRMLRSVR